MKRMLVGYVICAGLLLGGCASSEEDVDPSRIEYQTIHTDGEYGPTRTIIDAETNAELDRTTEEVEWEDQPVPIEREPDVKATFVFTPNDAPERSLDFGIWYEEQIIGGIDPKDSRGELTADQVTLFKSIFDDQE
ncbi:MAG: hypothetical protein F9K39_08595 [Exiguobacterium chiriqhucha]|uniref:hypothetical protein n=1 Tax=Exiguobacterium chiriqhucha TaxID=1385984 RepID=UPI00144CBF70|nr:hypothetical protein [Exiguobacterium chiriqhucha]KAB2863232.1 MAG: hypothetical protein F9K39_08595 [Exiguobacterium chiriqhucha]